jgi:lipoate-protein ligase A
MNDSWRIIDTGSCKAAFNMALDEAIATAVRQDLSPPALRLYGWEQCSVSIGYFQRSGELDAGYCREKGIQIVRRPTGGRAVFHQDEITYSFSIQTKTGLFSHGLFDSYQKIAAALSMALSKVGLSPRSGIRKGSQKANKPRAPFHNPLCFDSVSYGEISVNRNKVIGSAQKRWTDGLLQQGSIPFTTDEELILRLFQGTIAEMRNEPFRGLKHIMPSLSYDEVKNALWAAFEETFQRKLIRAEPSREELALAEELEAQKYLNDAWTFRR